MRCEHSSTGVTDGGVAPTEREPEADLPADRVKDAKRLRRESGVVRVEPVGVEGSLSGVAAAPAAPVLRLAVQVALRLNGGVMGSDDPEEVDESIEGGIEVLEAVLERCFCRVIERESEVMRSWPSKPVPAVELRFNGDRVRLRIKPVDAALYIYR